MKTIIHTLICAFILILSSCKAKTIYLPVERVKVEYRESIKSDSVYLHDSVLIRMKGDTVYFEKYKYLYRDKILRDSVFKTDSIPVPYPVEVVKEVNVTTSFQSFQIWCGRILILLLIGYFGYKLINSKLK